MLDTMTFTKIIGGFCGALLFYLLGNWAAESFYHVGGHGHGEKHAYGYAIEIEEEINRLQSEKDRLFNSLPYEIPHHLQKKSASSSSKSNNSLIYLNSSLILFLMPSLALRLESSISTGES